MMAFCTGYLVIFSSILLYQEVSSNKTMEHFYDDFKDIDSDFDLRKAISNFKMEDFANITEDVASKMTDLGPKPVEVPSNSSAEIMRLLKMGQGLIDTPSDRKLQQMRRSINEKYKEQLSYKNKTKIRKAEGKKRVKRQGKFQEAAKISNLKMLRIYLTMLKNTWSRTFTGGAHPFHLSVPQYVCSLFKQRIMKFFFPPVGDEKKI